MGERGVFHRLLGEKKSGVIGALKELLKDNVWINHVGRLLWFSFLSVISGDLLNKLLLLLLFLLSWQACKVIFDITDDVSV